MLWEGLCAASPSRSCCCRRRCAIWDRIIHSLPTLAADFRQTFLKAVLIGYALGCGAGFLAAIAVDRSPFLKRGLLPIGNFVSALPIIGVAPIMVMWFGFDWPVQGGGGRHHDLLPDAGEHRRRAWRRPATSSAT